MRIAVDAMGGDFAPREVVAGAVQAVREIPDLSRLFLVGDEGAVRAELDQHRNVPLNKIEIAHASEVVGMDEAPASAIRRKKDSSIGRAVDMVKKGEAEAVFSAGNTGAAVAATTLKLRTLQGVDRPAIATVFPTKIKPFVLLDAGATPDCTSELLFQFAVMGMFYSREILHVPEPTVGLLSIGGEAAKGNEITKEAFRRLEQSNLNFLGNVESSDIFSGKVDVVVCDGFVGNVVLKTSESVARMVGDWMKDEFMSSWISKVGALLCSGAIRKLKHRADPAVYGGAPLMGVNGVCIIGHGSSSAVAVFNGIRVACEAVDHHVNHLITEELNNVQGAAL